MIDTIKFFISIEDESILTKIKNNFKRFRKDDLKTGHIEFEFFTGDFEMGTYHRKVGVKSTNNPLGLFIEFSLPKYSKGNNVEMIHAYDLPKIMDQFYDELCIHINYPLAHYSTWVIYKLDICYNWTLEDQQKVLYAMNFLRRIDFPRKKKYLYDTSVMHLGSSYVVKFYSKGPEFTKNDSKKISFDRSYALQMFADKIVRFEVGLKRTYLADQLLKDTVYVSDISDDELILQMLNFFLKDKMFQYIKLDSMSNENIKETLMSNYSKTMATRLYQFYKDFYFNEEIKHMLLSGGLNRSTIYRYKKCLQKVGIGISTDALPETAHILKLLIIPSPTSKFDLLDYK
ncbi:MAG: phage/plasmid replication protein [Patescibacteria group bacterium]